MRHSDPMLLILFVKSDRLMVNDAPLDAPLLRVGLIINRRENKMSLVFRCIYPGFCHEEQFKDFDECARCDWFRGDYPRSPYDAMSERADRDRWISQLLQRLKAGQPPLQDGE